MKACSWDGALREPHPMCTTPSRFAATWARLAVVLLYATSLSCAGSLRNPFRSSGPPAPEVLAQGATLADVIAVVNQNSDRLQSLQTTNASISVSGMPGVPMLTGHIAAQRPGRLRMEASAPLVRNVVDLGANDELFWFWVRDDNSPALYYARRDQMVQGRAADLLPIDPQWLLDALGFARLDPAAYHEGPTPTSSGALEIRSVVHSLRGPITRLSLIDARRAWILEQHAYDASGTLLASAVARAHRYDPALQISVPQKVDLRLPAADLSLSIDMGTSTINAPLDNPQLWIMPVKSGVPQVDLSSGPGNMPRAPIGTQLIEASMQGFGPSQIPADRAPQWAQTDSGRVGRLPAGGVAAPLSAVRLLDGTYR